MGDAIEMLGVKTGRVVRQLFFRKASLKSSLLFDFIDMVFHLVIVSPIWARLHDVTHRDVVLRLGHLWWHLLLLSHYRKALMAYYLVTVRLMVENMTISVGLAYIGSHRS